MVRSVLKLIKDLLHRATLSEGRISLNIADDLFAAARLR